MGKLRTPKTHIDITQVKNVGDPISKSKALKRVLSYGKGEGIFLTSQQLIEIGEKLQTIPTGPDGIWFLIGDARAEGVNKNTVELIPYKRSNLNRLAVYKEDNKVGYLSINGVLDNLIDNNEKIEFPTYPTAKVVKQADGIGGDVPVKVEVPTPGGPSSQRTPPPTPEQ